MEGGLAELQIHTGLFLASLILLRNHNVQGPVSSQILGKLYHRCLCRLCAAFCSLTRTLSSSIIDQSSD